MPSSQPRQQEKKKPVNNQLHLLCSNITFLILFKTYTTVLNTAMAGGSFGWLSQLLTHFVPFQSERDLKGTIAAANNLL